MHQAKLTLNPSSSKFPDALSKNVTAASLTKMLHEAKALNIKAFLMDQHIIRGEAMHMQMKSCGLLD